MRQRLVVFAGLVMQWVTKESRLTTGPTLGMGQNFELFDFPERVRAKVGSLSGKRNMSLAAAQEYLITHTNKCHALIEEFQQEYYSLLFDNYAISFVPFVDEADLFYAEALTIGLLRPPLNQG
jgi:hypothetical protein